MHTEVTLTRSKVKVTYLPKFRKLHFSRSISSVISALRSQLMGDYDSMGPSLQLFRARFLNFSPFGGHVKSLRSSRNVDITRIHCVLSPRWPRLEACDCGRNKPCTLAAMTVSPLAGLFHLWSPYVIGRPYIFLPCSFFLLFFFLA